ncbi:hypothetical protein ACP70R_013171 [Stipagrostis hirtigluma subsp. patula]
MAKPNLMILTSPPAPPPALLLQGRRKARRGLLEEDEQVAAVCVPAGGSFQERNLPPPPRRRLQLVRPKKPSNENDDGSLRHRHRGRLAAQAATLFLPSTLRPPERNPRVLLIVRQRSEQEPPRRSRPDGQRRLPVRPRREPRRQTHQSWERIGAGRGCGADSTHRRLQPVRPKKPSNEDDHGSFCHRHRGRFDLQNGILEFFALFGRGGKRNLLAGVDRTGSVGFLYDLAENAVGDLPRISEPKDGCPVSLPVGDALYVVNRRPPPGCSCGFEALTLTKPELCSGVPEQPDWCWRRLPPPPYVLDPDYDPANCVDAYTVVDGDKIWTSTPGVGTYSFDTATASWSKAGDWELPFRGRADYLPEYGTWIGFSSPDNLLCSSDLVGASAGKTKPPALHYIWMDLRTPAGWRCDRTCLVRLAAGKFCVAKFFHKRTDESEGRCFYLRHERFVVLTGVTLEHGVYSDELRMMKHKSYRYNLEATTNGWVF